MAEYLQSIEIGIRVDTNKRTLLYEREVSGTAELEEVMKEFLAEVREDLSND